MVSRTVVSDGCGSVSKELGIYVAVDDSGVPGRETSLDSDGEMDGMLDDEMDEVASDEIGEEASDEMDEEASDEMIEEELEATDDGGSEDEKPEGGTVDGDVSEEVALEVDGLPDDEKAEEASDEDALDVDLRVDEVASGTWHSKQPRSQARRLPSRNGTNAAFSVELSTMVQSWGFALDAGCQR